MAAAQPAAAFNPLPTRLRDAAAFRIERWADEDAAHHAGSRPLAARSLAGAALAALTASAVTDTSGASSRFLEILHP